MFKKKNIKQPVNVGESRVSLNILRECGYNKGLCELLSSDPENGINGDDADIKRRKKAFGNHSIQLPKIPSFFTFFAKQFEDPLVIMLIWMAVMLLGIAFFSTNPQDEAATEDATEASAPTNETLFSIGGDTVYLSETEDQPCDAIANNSTSNSTMYDNASEAAREAA